MHVRTTQKTIAIKPFTEGSLSYFVQDFSRGSEFGGNFRLFGPGNQTIITRGFRSNFEVTLPGEGIYTLVLDNSRANSVNYSFRVV